LKNCMIMGELSINTPALLFPAITLLMLAYTNRFLALAKLVRDLHGAYLNRQMTDTGHGASKATLVKQIRSLRARLNLIRYMQGLGVLSFLLCVVCMYLIFRDYPASAGIVFAISLLSLMASLVISLVEIIRSTNAIELELGDIEELEKGNFFSDILPGRKDD
jgi:Protein of unknown function (DUF2721)